LDYRYQVRWNGKDIIVVDMVVVTEPYTPADCVAVPGKNAALERIKRVVCLFEQRRHIMTMRDQTDKRNAS